MNKQDYRGFETGPIRPPSEHASLLLRVTRNCPWNRCRFCTLYKGKTFSIRSKDDIKADLDAVRSCIDLFETMTVRPEHEAEREYRALMDRLGPGGLEACQSAAAWYRSGMESVFLQDANTMLTKPDDLVEILEYLRALFPEVRRVTSYGRSHTIARISDDNLKRIAAAGLNRIHIGMESGSDRILQLVDKGADKETHIAAGKKVKAAGIELSEYYIPGLGGKEYSRENALETADAINQINPDFIRIRTLSVPRTALLYKDYQDGIFKRTDDTDVVNELRLFISALKEITSAVRSDHMLNLITEVDGKLPEDKEKMLAALDWYLDLPEQEKLFFRVGRRTGIIYGIADFRDSGTRDTIARICEQNDITPGNINSVIKKLMNRFI
ncbi:MAG: radical SAM protein [Clostridiales bacterium]|nr:radical SAM protein [Clostridiales bacterium]